MGSYKEPKKLIQEYLDGKAKSDELFEKMYKKPGKDIDSCWAYIVNMAKRKGGACVCMSDDEVFGLAVHYYCEDDLEVKKLQEEGDFMHHCVATNEYYKKKDSLIMSAVDECGNRLETIEINLKTMKVVQCFGMYNKTTDRHQEILEVINGNMKEVIKANSFKM